MTLVLKICPKCQKRKADNWESFVADINNSCFAQSGMIMPLQLCKDRQQTLLMSLARTGFLSTLELALNLGYKETEAEARKALALLDAMDTN